MIHIYNFVVELIIQPLYISIMEEINSKLFNINAGNRQMYKLAMPSNTDVDDILVQIESSNQEMWNAMNGDADDDTIYRIDENIIKNLYALSERKSQNPDEKRKIIEFALSKIEQHVDFDTSMLYYTKLIRKNLPAS
jgi:hypothetical protein